MTKRDQGKHEPTIFQARRDGSFRWLCSCGVESDYFKGRKAAENDHDEHVTSLARAEQ